MKMLRFYTFIILFSLSFGAVSQSTVQLNSEDKAYLYHIVMKSPTLKRNISKYFDYEGKMIWLKDTVPNYDSLELMIIQKPEILTIYTHDLSRVSQGVLAEAANKMAIWKLNKALYHRKDKNVEANRFVNTLSSFYDTLRVLLPEKAVKSDKDERYIHPRVLSILTPTLTLKEKFSSLNSFHLFSDAEKKQIIEGINGAVIRWVSAESNRYFQLLGGHTDSWENHLMAAGDGSITSGLLSEQEKDKKGRWNKGLPRAIGLFPYQIDLVKEKKKTRLEPKRIAKYQNQTFGNNFSTLIHLDVWGYNDKKQTTVVIEKNNRQYVLYGSRESKLLSPDSSFSGGTTYYSYIHKLEHVYIKDLHEKMHGKKGYKYQLEMLRKQKDNTLLDIKQVEYDLSELRNSMVSVSKSGKKKRRAKQQALMQYYNRLSRLEADIKDLIEEMEEAHIKMANLREKLANMYENYGTDHYDFTYENGVYVFEDSATFDIRTQDFTFPSSANAEVYEVRLIGIPGNVFSKSADEVMLHLNQTEVDADRYMAINLRLTDFFAPDKFDIKSDILHREDSVACMEMMQALLKRSKVFTNFEGKGIGKLENKRLTKHPDPTEMNGYSSETHRLGYKPLRTSLFQLSLKNKVTISVKSFTDPVKSSLVIQNKKILKLMNLYPKMTKNDVLSALRTKALVTKFQEEFGVLCGKYLSRKEASKVIDLINNQIKKSKISIGKTSLKFVDVYL